MECRLTSRHGRGGLCLVFCGWVAKKILIDVIFGMDSQATVIVTKLYVVTPTLRV